MVFHHSPADGSETSTVSATRPNAWVVALSCALLIYDYMSRQVLNAVFPQYKSEWAPNDSQLGLLSDSSSALVFCYGKTVARGMS